SKVVSDSVASELRPSRSIQEFFIDLLLEEEFTVDPAFLQAFVDACHSPFLVKAAERVSHSVSDKNGEADLVVIVAVERPNGETAKLALLIEDKITAGFQPGQAERYRKRGEDGLSEGRWDSYVTVLVAPSAYIPHAHGFDTAISLEQIK